jgi:GAF domain-containing protein
MTEDRDTTGTSRHLGDVMSRVARELQEEHGDVEATLQAITKGAVATVPGAEECSISYVIGRTKVEPRAGTGELPRYLDMLQQELEQGPCLDAIWESEVVRVDDLGADGRWPRFAARAAEQGIGSMLCFQLFVAGDQLGAMNLYSSRPHAFDGEGQEIGHMFAGHAAVALAGAEHEEQLRAGMNSRDLIGQAKGILMERFRLTALQAFDVLSRVSQELNRKLVDVAAELTETGALPARPEPRD